MSRRLNLLVRGLGALVLVLTTLIATPSTAGAQGIAIETSIVQVSPTVVGKLARPSDPAERSHVAILTMHPRSSHLNHNACDGLPRRGFTVLCQNGRFTQLAGANDNIYWDDLMLDVKAGVDYLYNLPGITRVVLYAHSGGGALMTSYQAIAENGAAHCQRPERIYKCPDSLNGFRPADGIIVIDAHLGYGANQWMLYNDPSILHDDPFGQIDPAAYDPTLDPLLPENGYHPTNPSYSEEFMERYYYGQYLRSQRQLDLALERWAAVQAGESEYVGNEPFVIPRHYASLHTLDTRVNSRTRGSYPLLTVNGLEVTQIHSIRPIGGIAGDPKEQNARWDGQGTFKIDLRSFITTYAVRPLPEWRMSEDNIVGVDFDSSNNSVPTNVAAITSPTLFMAATGFYLVVPTEIHYEWSAAPDKEIVFIEGAQHDFNPCRPCESTPGQFGDTLSMTHDYIAAWINARF